METQGPLELQIWREVARHAELPEFTARLMELLSPELPVSTLMFVHLLPGNHSVEVVGTGAAGKAVHAHPTTLAAGGYAALVRWCRRRDVTRLPADGAWPSPLAALSMLRDGREFLAAPLGSATSPNGVVLLGATGDKRFTAPDGKSLERLLDALGAAMDNHVRSAEISKLRAAAEAERQSLLMRLGREDLEEEIVGASQGLKPVMQRVVMVAGSDASVLILGETGAGKEMVARAIHGRSARAQGPFIRVNCGAISPELIDSELFGHDKGSFTGAVAMRRGWFERADGGTLFLDEIGDLPASAQVRLLRVLQDGCFYRVGGEQEIEVDVRIVAATHRDIAVMVQQGRFREDLWYRIAVFPIILPPLRERRADIPALALHFAQRAARRLGLPTRAPTADDVGMLQAYDWPGNVRELSAVLERAAILGQGDRLMVGAALGISPLASRQGDRLAATATQSPTIDSLDIVMRAHIEAVLIRTHGRVAGEHGAARLLDINANTLRAKMRKLGIETSVFKRRR